MTKANDKRIDDSQLSPSFADHMRDYQPQGAERMTTTDDKQMAEIRAHMAEFVMGTKTRRHFEFLLARIGELTNELEDWSRTSCATALRTRKFETLLTAARETCEIMDVPEDEFGRVEQCAVNLVLADKVGPAVKDLDGVAKGTGRDDKD